MKPRVGDSRSSRIRPSSFAIVTGEARDALAQMGIALCDQSGNLRRSEDLLGEVADAFTRIEDPAERIRLAFKAVRLRGRGAGQPAPGGSSVLEEMRERARDLGIVLDEALVRDAERARTSARQAQRIFSHGSDALLRQRGRANESGGSKDLPIAGSHERS